MRVLAKAVLFLLPVLVILLSIDRYPFHPGSEYSDLMISHYPNALYLQRALAEAGEIPLWSGLILSGYPFAANPLSGLYYPPGWLALLVPLQTGFNLTIVLHLLWGGAGLYLFLRSEGLSAPASIFGALVFEAMPKLYAHLSSGHLTLLYAVPWTPWLLLAEKRFQDSTSHWRFLLPGLVLGAIILADIRWGAYSGIAWLSYLTWQAVKTGQQADSRTAKVVSTAGRAGANVVVAILSSAVLLLPFLQYTSLSTRGRMLPGENLLESLNPAQLLGLIYPHLRGPAETTLYPGGLALALFVLAVFTPGLRKRAGFWVWAVVVTLALALGSNFFASAWFFNLPGLGLLRVPSRVLFFTGLAFAVISAYGVDALLTAGARRAVFLSRHSPENRGAEDHTGTAFSGMRRSAQLFLFGMVVFAVLFGLAVVLAVPEARIKVQFGWGTAVILLSTAVVFAAVKGVVSQRRLAFLLLTLALTDLTAFNALGLEFRAPCDSVADLTGAATYLSFQDSDRPFRIYSPSYSIPQQVAASYELELADGVDPLILASYQAFMEPATGVPSEGYSVTLPPYADDPSSDNRFAVPDAELLGILNVKYVVAEFEIPGDDFRLLAAKKDTRIYENLKFLPRAWVQDEGAQVGRGIVSMPDVKMGINHIRMQATGPGLLVLSEVMYPGWRVKVDGKEQEVETVNGLLRGVRLVEGSHQVVFSFWPVPVFAGAAISGAAWLGALAVALVSFWRRNRAGAAV